MLFRSFQILEQSGIVHYFNFFSPWGQGAMNTRLPWNLLCSHRWPLTSHSPTRITSRCQHLPFLWCLGLNVECLVHDTAIHPSYCPNDSLAIFYHFRLFTDSILWGWRDSLAVSCSARGPGINSQHPITHTYMTGSILLPVAPVPGEFNILTQTFMQAEHQSL